MKLIKIPVGKVEKWLVDEAKEVGLDIDGFEHEITNEFVNHVMNNHGDKKIETAIGQIAVKEDDFKKIPEIVKKPDMAIVGAKREDKTMVIYAKEMLDRTTLYFEEVLDGRRNKTLRGKTMFKRKDGIDREKVINIVTNKEKTDISGAKIVLGYGSQPVLERKPERAHHPAAATSAIPQDTSNISQSREKSSEIEIARKAGYVQGVCECVAIIGDDHTLSKKLLSEMNVTKDMAKKFANPETYKTLEKGIFAQKQDQKLEQTQGVKR
jgi:hypothetical protein